MEKKIRKSSKEGMSPKFHKNENTQSKSDLIDFIKKNSLKTFNFSIRESPETSDIHTLVDTWKSNNAKISVTVQQSVYENNRAC